MKYYKVLRCLQFRRYIFRIVLRSFSVHPPFILRSSSVQAPFELRSGSVRAPFGLRSSSDRESKIDRRLIAELTENHRRQDGDVSKL